MKKRWPDETSRRLYRDLQRRLARRIVLAGPENPVRLLLAVDVSYREEDAYVSAVIWNTEKACPVRIYLLRVLAELPYISGMFFIRELPPVVSIIRTFSIEFDLLLLNASGIAHPAGIGLASHAGLYFKKPSFGITDRIPCGAYKMPGLKKGNYTRIMDRERRVIGYVLRSQDYVRPIFITPGHLISPKNALEITIKLPFHARFPEPLRIADIYSRKEFKKEIIEGCR